MGGKANTVFHQHLTMSKEFQRVKVVDNGAA